MAKTFIVGEEKRLDIALTPIPPPPEEAAFSVNIFSTALSAPVGVTITIPFSVTNLSDFKSGHDLMIYLDGKPFSSSYFHMDPILAGQTVTNPSPSFTHGARITSPVPATKVFKICVFSIPTGMYSHCDQVTLTWY